MCIGRRGADELLTGHRRIAFNEFPGRTRGRHRSRRSDSTEPRRYFRNGRGEPDTTDKRLRKQLAGDLDTIALKALRKIRTNAMFRSKLFRKTFANYRGGHPIGARPDKRVVSTRKFVGRNALPVASTALVVIALLIGSAVALCRRGSPPNNENRAFVLADAMRRRIVLHTVIPTSLEPANDFHGQMLERSESIARKELPASRAIGGGVPNAGGHYRAKDNLEKAETVLAQSVAMTRESQDPSLRASILCQYGLVHYNRAGVDAGKALFNEALDIRVSIGDRVGVFAVPSLSREKTSTTGEVRSKIAACPGAAHGPSRFARRESGLIAKSRRSIFERTSPVVDVFREDKLGTANTPTRSPDRYPECPTLR